LIRPFRIHVLSLSALSFVGAMVEAGVLIGLTNTMLAVTEQSSSVGYGTLELSIGHALIATLALLVLRLGLAMAGVTVSASLSTAVLRSARNRISSAYIRASWATQKASPTGRLQELTTTFVDQATHSVKALSNWITSWLSLLAFLLAAAVVDWVSTLYVIGSLVILGAGLYPLRKAIHRRSDVQAHSGLDFASAVSEFGALGLETQVYGVQRGVERSVKSLSDNNTAARFRVQILSESLPPIYMALAYAGVIGGGQPADRTGRRQHRIDWWRAAAHVEGTRVRPGSPIAFGVRLRSLPLCAQVGVRGHRIRERHCPWRIRDAARRRTHQARPRDIRLR
jgi:hypothetical protein